MMSVPEAGTPAIAPPARRRDVLVREVGPCAGLQRIDSIMPTATKQAWIRAAADAGVAEVEVGAFVSTQAFPQLADTADLVAFARGIPGLAVAVRVPDFAGAQDAVACGVHRITMGLSVSEACNLHSVQRTQAQMVEEARQTAALIRSLPPERRPHFQGTVAAAFGCRLEGAIAPDRVLDLAVTLMEAGCDEIGLSDCSGHAHPAQVRNLIRMVWSAVGRDQLSGIHLFNTRGQGLANAMAAIDVGLKGFDASFAGLGGDPASPGGNGSLVTEDLVFMLEAMGLRTGIDIPALFAIRDLLRQALPGETLHGLAPRAGLPRGFVAASPQRRPEGSPA